MPERKIAPKKAVIEALKNTMRRRFRVESQEDLRRLVLKELAKTGKNYALTPLRMRRIALSVPEMEIKAETKKLTGLEKIDKCPVCESEVKPFRVNNLMNRKIVIGYECVNCGYQSDLEAFMPMKYSFIWKPSQP